MEEGSLKRAHAPQMGVDEDLVVEAEERVVEGRPVQADLDSGLIEDRFEVLERQADPGVDPESEVLLLAAAADFVAVDVAEGQTDPAAALGLVGQEAGEVRVLFEEENGGIGDDRCRLLSPAEQVPPQLRWSIGAARIQGDQSGPADLDRRQCRDGVSP
jgi:hypothetical protein